MITYNEVYGFMPKEIINKLSESDKNKMFTIFLTRKPTATGWFFTNAVMNVLGDEFIEYLLNMIVPGIILEKQTVDRESILDGLKELCETFASDINILYEWVELYFDEFPDRLEEFVGGDNQKEESKPAAKQGRDPKTGRFMKKQ